ncbi:hypothetical protein [Frankia sp. QA3]|uniref:hypothetical protein n=1 Tax=Frankia sp. QA3 TaxID=710111 RepID=UPI0012F75D90|nr:hypothetical protein [Frankia sp. QA3]
MDERDAPMVAGPMPGVDPGVGERRRVVAERHRPAESRTAVVPLYGDRGRPPRVVRAPDPP